MFRDGIWRNTFYLTRRKYYQDSWLNYSTKKWLRWCERPKLRKLNKSAALHHFKTSNMDELQSSIENYNRKTASICKIKLIPKKYARLNFFTHRKKKSTIHRFLAKLVKSSNVNRPTMFYGDGSFASGGKGMRSVPCKWVKSECKHFFKTFSINEFRTSQVCPDCNQRLFNVRKDLRNGSRTYVRGMKYCVSEACRSHRYKSRDDVGCANIFRKRLAVYPSILDNPRSNDASPTWDELAGIHDFRSKF